MLTEVSSCTYLHTGSAYASHSSLRRSTQAPTLLLHAHRDPEACVSAKVGAVPWEYAPPGRPRSRRMRFLASRTLFPRHISSHISLRAKSNKRWSGTGRAEGLRVGGPLDARPHGRAWPPAEAVTPRQAAVRARGATGGAGPARQTRCAAAGLPRPPDSTSRTAKLNNHERARPKDHARCRAVGGPAG